MKKNKMVINKKMSTKTNNQSFVSLSSKKDSDSLTKAQTLSSSFIEEINKGQNLNKDEDSFFKTERAMMLSFYFQMKCLRYKYKLDNSRKNQIDSIIKKIKVKFFKAIHEVLRRSLKFKFSRLPQNFVSNTKISYNKEYFNKTLGEIYTEFNVLPSISEIIDQNQNKSNKKELLIELLNNKVIDIYDFYLKSNLYKYDKDMVTSKEGSQISILFDFVSHNISKYFFSSGTTVGNISGINNKNFPPSIKEYKYSSKKENNAIKGTICKSIKFITIKK